MEVQLTPDEHAQLVQIAHRTGKSDEEIVHEAIHSFLQGETAFVKAVEKGLASLDRDEYVTHEDVGARIRTLFQP